MLVLYLVAMLIQTKISAYKDKKKHIEDRLQKTSVRSIFLYTGMKLEQYVPKNEEDWKRLRCGAIEG